MEQDRGKLDLRSNRQTSPWVASLGSRRVPLANEGTADRSSFDTSMPTHVAFGAAPAVDRSLVASWLF